MNYKNIKTVNTINNDTIKLTDKQIQELLSYEFQALMLLEENPNNKWVLPKKRRQINKL